MEAVAHFENSIVSADGFITLQRLTEDDIIGTDEKQGLLEQYLTLWETGTPMQDIALGTEEVRIGNKRLSLQRFRTRTTYRERYRQIPF